jgi:hypothetical protein
LAVRPLVLTETWKLAGVVLLAVALGGDTLSHEFPEVTAALTVAEPEVIPIFTVWALGCVPPVVYPNVSGVLGPVNDGGGTTVKVTGIVVAANPLVP